MINNVVYIRTREIYKGPKSITGFKLKETNKKYLVKDFFSKDVNEIPKDMVKTLLTQEGVYKIVGELKSEEYIQLAKTIKNRNSCIGSSSIVFNLLVEMEII